MNQDLIPQNFDAECAVIGAIVAFSAWPRIADKLVAGDFFDRLNRRIWMLAAEVEARGELIDAVSIHAEAQNRDLDDELRRDLMLRMVECGEQTPGAANAVLYAAIVKGKSLERKMLTAAQSIQETIFGAGETNEKIEACKQAVLDVEGERMGGPLHVSEILPKAVAEIERRSQGMTGLPIGFVDLDKRFQGWNPGDVIVLAARPSMGKTTLAMNIAANVSINGHVLVFSLEMSRGQLMDRLISAVGGVPLSLLRNGAVCADPWFAERFAKGVSEVKHRGITIDDTRSLTALDIRSRARTHTLRQGVDLIVIDYLQLIGGAGSNANERVSQISREIKMLAGDVGCPVLLLSQLSRATEQRVAKRPQLSDLRDSGAIEQDSDIVMFIYREDVYEPSTPRKNIAEIITAKFRNGEIGTDYLTTELSRSRFENHNGDLPPEMPAQQTWSRGME